MNVLIHSFMSWTLFWRAAILLFFIIVVVWKVFGKRLLWILSIIPFSLQWFFRLIYLLVEAPISLLHKKLGASFYKISNGLSQYAERTDSIMERWYNKWHLLERVQLWKALMVYVLCVTLVMLPSLIEVEGNVYRKGETVYLHCEAALISWFEEHGWYRSVELSLLEQDLGFTHDNPDILPELNAVPIVLIVSGLKSSLLVRDIPSVEDSVELDRLYNGNSVIWSGELIFAEMNNERIEPWVKVMTPNGIEGWTRMSYLYPEEYREVEFYVQMQEQNISEFSR